MANGDLIPGDDAWVNLNGRIDRVNLTHIDRFFIPTLNIQLKEGRNFSDSFNSDSDQSVIVNETFVEETELRNPIGQQITMTDGLGIHHKASILGVVKDFHYASLKEKINPLVLVWKQAETMWIKLQKGKIPEALSVIQTVFKRTFPDYFYEYTFLDDEIRDQYANEERWKQIIGYSSGLAIIICSLGLFGLAHFSTTKRTKEIGIRKVLGASVINISTLLSKDFLQLVLLSVLIASPVAWYAMNKWLQNFNYRTNISWLDFTAAAVIALVIALVTVSSQAVKAAGANPIESLRVE